MNIHDLDRLNTLNKKAVRVVTSCTTINQLESARRYVNLFDSRVSDMFYRKIKDTDHRFMVDSLTNKLYHLIKALSIQIKDR